MSAIDELRSEHRRADDGVGCVVCYPQDGRWPCTTSLIVDELEARLDTSTPLVLEVSGVDQRRPLTINAVGSMTRFQWASRTALTRSEWHAAAHELTPLDACSVHVIPLHKNRATPQDVAACAPEAKAAVDGIVDAGLLVDDAAQFVPYVSFGPPEVCGVNGLRLVLTPVERLWTP